MHGTFARLSSKQHMFTSDVFKPRPAKNAVSSPRAVLAIPRPTTINPQPDTEHTHSSGKATEDGGDANTAIQRGTSELNIRTVHTSPLHQRNSVFIPTKRARAITSLLRTKSRPPVISPHIPRARFPPLMMKVGASGTATEGRVPGQTARRRRLPSVASAATIDSL